MEKIRYPVAVLAVALAVFHFAAGLFDLRDSREITRTMTDAEGNIHDILFLVRQVLSGLFSTLAVLHFMNSRINWSLLLSAGVIGMYAWWYVERYRYLAGVTAGTEEYRFYSESYGILIGSRPGDFIAVFASALLICVLFTRSIVSSASSTK